MTENPKDETDQYGAHPRVPGWLIAVGLFLLSCWRKLAAWRQSR